MTQHAFSSVCAEPEVKSLPVNEIWAQAKRFLEWYEGSRSFREDVRKGVLSPGNHELILSLGVSSQVLEEMISFMHSNTSTIVEPVFAKFHSGCDKDINDIDALYSKAKESIDKSIASRVVNIVVTEKLRRAYAQLSHLDKSLNKLVSDQNFLAWRSRRIRATRSELGSYSLGLDHPVFSIELSRGCSVGCTFCGFAAEKLKDNFDFANHSNRALFRAVAEAFRDVLQVGSGGGMLYYATEPNDNPHYISFLEEWYQVTGYKLCTSTARYDIQWIKDLMNFYSDGSTHLPWPRISVLSKHIMLRIHKAFTPLEFLNPWFTPQQIEVEDERMKAPSGREEYGLKSLSELKDCRHYEFEADVDYSNIPQGSIACVSGFRVNMIDRTITLTSPCFASKQWPKGYRDYATVVFTEDPQSVKPALLSLIQSKMPLKMPNDHIVRWRDDLRFRIHKDGYELVSPVRFHKFYNQSMLTSATIEIIQLSSAGKNLTKSQVIENITSRLPLLSREYAEECLEKFYRCGYLSDIFA